MDKGKTTKNTRIGIDIPEIDETKLPAAMEIIERAASLMAEKDCDSDPEAEKDLAKLQGELRDLSGNSKIQIRDFQRYWSYTDLETMARKTLLPVPFKTHVTDGQIKEIVLHILTHKEAETDWWLTFLKINTGLDNLTDYIFYPVFVGLDAQATLEQIADKIITDRK